MIETDRRNYRIAILVSLIFHGSLILVCLPAFFSPKPVPVDTLPVGMVEIAPGSGKSGGELQAAGNSEVKQASQSQPVKNDTTQKTTKTDTVKTITAKKPDEKSTSTRDLSNKKTDSDKENSIAATKGDKQPVQQQPKDSKESKDSKDSGGTSGSNNGAGGTASGGSGGTGGENAGNGNGSGAGNGNGSGPVGLGTGEGKVSRMGPVPPYPKNAMNEGKEGEVGVRILVRADGSLEQVNVQKSSGDDRLDRAAVVNIEKNWKFAPETKDYYIDLIFAFSIQNGVSIKFVNSQTRP